MSRRVFLKGVKEALILPAWIVGFTLLGIGSLAQGVGHPVGAVILSTLLIWAGPAQVIFYGSLASGAALPAIAVAVCLSSVRFLPMTMSVLPLLKGGRRSQMLQILAAHCVAVTVWLQSLRRLPSMAVEERVPYYFGFAAATICLSSIMTFAGYYLAWILPTALVAGLLFLNPLFFIISLSAGAQNLAGWIAVVLGFCLAPILTVSIGQEFDLLMTGAIGGSIAYAIDRFRRVAP